MELAVYDDMNQLGLFHVFSARFIMHKVRSHINRSVIAEMTLRVPNFAPYRLGKKNLARTCGK
ncbi:hypothetical protein [Legionella pneumophila]|uniref:hypothetical protein n=1 Tax=Legionella pneumophila TaxID=446 RepID=UPI000D7BDC54|nr:hypothetical protein [Legionella pneumophila]PYB52835.1 hypothetical protein DM459_07435 [Legionella pneumophila]PYB56656.1 hypothetical protein DM457_07435 [Legionella pneumophila]PYB59558.1 hypothetical protein DM458_09375 [Legionella pneumophila]TID53433.1 hypothetical protein DIZ65_07435 [Legionella pneumophila]TIE48724.1 hypothetical protein DIZ53_07435 [Legionella pneumophila]